MITVSVMKELMKEIIVILIFYETSEMKSFCDHL